jgi:thioredoxin 1
MNKVIKFSADWCGPCKVYKPNYTKFAEEVSGKGIDVLDLDVDKNSDEASKYGVRSIPLTLFIKDGEVVDKISGVIPTSALLDKYAAVYQN